MLAETLLLEATTYHSDTPQLDVFLSSERLEGYRIGIRTAPNAPIRDGHAQGEKSSQHVQTRHEHLEGGSHQ